MEEEVKVKITRHHEIEANLREEEDKKLLKFKEADEKAVKKGTKLEKGLADTRQGLYLKISSRREKKEKEQFYDLKVIHETIGRNKKLIKEGLTHIKENKENEEQVLKTKEEVI